MDISQSPPIDLIFDELIKKLTLEGRTRVFQDERELTAKDIIEQQDPEEFTRGFLIDKVLFDIIGLDLIGRNRKFETPDGVRKVDYAVNYLDSKILIEAKPINADLEAKIKDSAVNQVSGVFRLFEVQEEYDYGIATDGIKWIFIDKEREIFAKYELRKNFQEIKGFLTGTKKLVKPNLQEISKKFYEIYNDLLHGTKKIRKEDCLINSISEIENEEEREEVAQIVVDRLIFVKFLQVMGIIKEDALGYLSTLEDHDLWSKMNQLFFEVMNTEKKLRDSIDPHFVGIPYLNGSLFERIEAEKRAGNYTIKGLILKEIIGFLSKFSFVRAESLDEFGDNLDPEILGYIFEKSMTAVDRKGTGAYYTPREITKYMAENAIYPTIIDKINVILKNNKGYKNTELLTKIDELLILPSTTLNEVWTQVILKLSVCDYACGSGAFLLAASNILFQLNKNVNDRLGLNNSDIALKKLVLKSIHGIDINSRAVEIARLRLWLWLIESYSKNNVESLPNIEYNLRTGNSLIGYVNIEKYAKEMITLDDFDSVEETVKTLLVEFIKLKVQYEVSTGENARELRRKIESVISKLKRQLNVDYYKSLKSVFKKINLTPDFFTSLKPFHYGVEFYDIFQLEDSVKERGFDIIMGNPPYVDSELMVKTQADFRTMLSKLFETATGNWDLYIPFFERAINAVNEKGTVCLISPNKWLSAPYGSTLRSSLHNLVTRFCDCEEVNVFQDAGNTPVIAFFRKKPVNNSVKVERFGLNYTISKKKSVKRNVFDSENWGMITSKYFDILSFLKENNSNVGKYCDPENPFSVSEAYKLLKLLSDNEITKDSFKFVNTGTIDRHESLWGKSKTTYIKNKFDHPIVNAHDLQAAMPTRYEQSSTPKLIITGMRYLESFYDGRGEYIAGKSTIIIRKHENLPLSVLNIVINSKVAGFYIKEAYKTSGIDGGIGFKTNMIEELPIPELTKNDIEELSQYEEKISLKLENGDMKDAYETIDKVDKLLYKLYGLPQNYVDIIEKYKTHSGKRLD